MAFESPVFGISLEVYTSFFIVLLTAIGFLTRRNIRRSEEAFAHFDGRISDIENKNKFMLGAMSELAVMVGDGISKMENIVLGSKNLTDGSDVAGVSVKPTMTEPRQIGNTENYEDYIEIKMEEQKYGME